MIPTALSLIEAGASINLLLQAQEPITPAPPPDLEDFTKPTFLTLLAQLLLTAKLPACSMMETSSNVNCETQSPISHHPASPHAHFTAKGLFSSPVTAEFDQPLSDSLIFPMRLVPRQNTKEIPTTLAGNAYETENLSRLQLPHPQALGETFLSTLAANVTLPTGESNNLVQLPHGSAQRNPLLLASQEITFDIGTSQYFPDYQGIIKHRFTEALNSSSISPDFSTSVENPLPVLSALPRQTISLAATLPYPALADASLNFQSANAIFAHPGESLYEPDRNQSTHSASEFPLVMAGEASVHDKIVLLSESSKSHSPTQALSLVSQVTNAILRHNTASEHLPVVTVRLCLEPPELGSVMVHLRLQDNAMEAHIEVENPNTLMIFEQQREHLHNTLVQSGINVRTLLINYKGGEGGQRPYREDREPMPIKKPNCPQQTPHIVHDLFDASEAINCIV